MPASIHYGLLTDLRRERPKKPEMRWTRHTHQAPLVFRWTRPY